MARRELRAVDGDTVLGAVELVDGRATFDRYAEQVFGPLRTRIDHDEELAAGLIRDGWSNGKLYLAPEDEQ